MKWVRKCLSALRDEVMELDNIEITEAFEDLESSLDDLFNECEETISDVQGL